MQRFSCSAMFPFTACAFVLASCTGSLAPTEFINPSFDFGFVERVAVYPFENQSNDREAGTRTTRLFMTELLATGAVEVVETGEVLAAVSQIPRLQAPKVVRPSQAEIIALGEQLNVQALVLGTVTQSETLRSGQVGIPVVTLDVHLVETETGASVWAGTHTEQGGGLGKKVLGTGAEPISETTRRCIRRLISSLIE